MGTKHKNFFWKQLFLVLVLAGVYTGIGLTAALAFGLVPMPRQIEGYSMEPTLKNGTYIYAYPLDALLRKRTVNRGDIVLFSDKDTVKDGKVVDFVKRVVGVPNDQIEIKNGYVYRNGTREPEPYIAGLRSTFGNTFVADCQKITVPADSYFVLGDNRKRSMDSRMLGFIPRSAITSILPKSQQSSSGPGVPDDGRELSGSFLNVEEYISMLNAKREENNRKPLRFEPKLSKSAERRAKVILTYNDASFEATKSGYTMAKAVLDAGYSNIIYGEFPIFGYYTARELIEYEFENPKAKEFLLNKDYQDIGVSTFVGNADGCPVQIIVQHLAGYVPPRYSKETIQSWENALADLKRILPSWLNIKNYGLTYNQNKQDADRLLAIIDTRISRIRQFVPKMEANIWLTGEETQWTYDDQALYSEQQDLAKKLNAISWQR